MQEPRTELRHKNTPKAGQAAGAAPSQPCKLLARPSDPDAWVEFAMSRAIGQIEGEI